MTEEFFWCQKSYGNTTRFNSFYIKKKKTDTGSGTFGRTNQKLLRYDQRPSDMILWKQENFCDSKLLWLYNGLKFIFERFFSLRDNQSKMGFKLSIYWVAKLKPILENKQTHLAIQRFEVHFSKAKTYPRE